MAAFANGFCRRHGDTVSLARSAKVKLIRGNGRASESHIEQCRPKHRVEDIGAAIQAHRGKNSVTNCA